MIINRLYSSRHNGGVGRGRHQRWLSIATGILLIAGLASAASASLELLKPNVTDAATFVGNGGYSADGLGQFGTGGTVQAEVPAGSTVVQAYLYGTYFTVEPTVAERTIDFDGTMVELTKIDQVNFLSTARANVTAQVAAKVGGGGGITDFAVNNDPGTLDGVALVVIFQNPALPTTTIALLDGSASQLGDTTTFNFAAPLDKTVAGFSAIMSLGSGFSFQGPLATGHVCGPTAQFSTVTVNTQLLTSCAGNYDDGGNDNGALITVGGVGDSTNNPSPPATPTEDDELYDLAPFLAQGDAAITINSANPSQDDNLFLAVIAITARATVTTEICTDGLDNDGDTLIDAADPDCAPPPVEICGDGLDNDGDGLIDSADPDCAPTASTQRITGGGTLRSSGVSHGFTLHCDVSTPGLSNRLQVNWGKGQKFHLTELQTAVCSDNPAISEGKLVAGFDTYSGTGTGRYNGVDGATATWTISDAGEPGKNDVFTITIVDAGGNTVLTASQKLSSGNHQAHP